MIYSLSLDGIDDRRKESFFIEHRYFENASNADESTTDELGIRKEPEHESNLRQTEVEKDWDAIEKEQFGMFGVPSVVKLPLDVKMSADLVGREIFKAVGGFDIVIVHR